MTLDTKSPECACKCSKCGASITKDRDADLAEILKVLEVVPTRAEAQMLMSAVQRSKVHLDPNERDTSLIVYWRIALCPLQKHIVGDIS